MRPDRAEPPKPLATATTRPDGTWVLTLTPPAGAAAAPRSCGSRSRPAASRPSSSTRSSTRARARTPATRSVEKAATLAGKVVDARGGPVVGATVTLWGGSGGGASPFARVDGAPVPTVATTGADGTFRFTEATARGNRIRVEAPGFASTDVAGAAGGALRRPIALVLGRSVTGQVLKDDRRTPAGGALVRFEGRSVSRWFEARADGTVLVDGLASEAGTLVADAGEKGRGSAPLEAGASKATVVLAPTAILKGRVVESASGAPVARIRVAARSEGAVFVARSGPDGRYEIRGLPARAYALAADDPAYVAWSRDGVRVAPGATETEDVILTRGATLTGRIVDERGLPIEGATGRLTRGGEAGGRAFFRMLRGDVAFRSARDGSFTAPRLAPGDRADSDRPAPGLRGAHDRRRLARSLRPVARQRRAAQRPRPPWRCQGRARPAHLRRGGGADARDAVPVAGWPGPVLVHRRAGQPAAARDRRRRPLRVQGARGRRLHPDRDQARLRP